MQSVTLQKNQILLRENDICKSVFFIVSGSFVQYRSNEEAEAIIDLHLKNEWMFNQQSLVEQTPSCTTIKAFTDAEIVELHLKSIHMLTTLAHSFFQLGKLFNQHVNKIYIFDNSLNPAEKYEYIKSARPNLLQSFPIKMIASYLKTTPETLSRVRAKY